MLHRMEMKSPPQSLVLRLGAFTILLAAFQLLFAAWLALTAAVAYADVGLDGLVYFLASILAGLAVLGGVLAWAGISTREHHPRLALGLVLGGLLLYLVLVGSFVASAVAG